MNPNNNRLQPGTILANRYVIRSILGEGGMGVVYGAEDLKLNGKLWAIKQSFNNVGGIEVSSEEAMVLMQLKHPMLPDMIDYLPATDYGTDFLVMEYVEGETLQAHFERLNKKLPHPAINQWILQLCDVFQYLHEQPVHPYVYRDLKPSNVMIDQRKGIRLIDFGIARTYKAGQQQDTVPIGTVGFAAPEQFNGNQSDHRSDLYALGALMYYLYSGGHYAMPGWVSQTELLEIEAVEPQLLQVISKLLRVNPAERYQSASELRSDLHQVTQHSMQSISPQSVRNPERSVFNKPMNKKIVAFTSVYRGAGASFVQHAVAKGLSAHGVPHAVLDFRHSSDILEYQHKMLAAKEPLVLLDLSLETLGNIDLEQVDMWFLIATPMPAVWTLNEEQWVPERIDYLTKQGGKVYWIGNRDVVFPSRKRWLQSFPEQPVCFIPDIPYLHCVDSFWKQKSILDLEEYATSVLEAIVPVLEILLPQSSRLETATIKHRLIRSFHRVLIQMK
ncbi:serine/threonine protein kinase [Paenibacillus swuensis]|uniref:serine/threonine protein kinase n=1 Tax=Paenibacillus swuensis TaxID=1178515 RepID=UPI0008394736|nr:serine/threonine-protein kinase [Paenibacillus swuensis]